jgi:uncharacterized protein YecE (DUF72 family)
LQQARKIKIGTSGWHYQHWREVFYEKELKKEEWLCFYACHLHTVEINNSFYQLPEVQTLRAWKNSVPDDFIFSVKASRYITHMKKLKKPREALRTFMHRIEILENKLGAVIFQLPPFWKCNYDRLAAFLKLLSSDFRYAFEFRHVSWWNEKVYELLSRYNIAFCIFELNRQLSPKKRTADFVYVRLHGPGAAYQGSYDTQTLAGWAGTFSAFSRDDRQIYCYFDNDQKGFAIQNALQLQSMIS